jgi:K(+)-stimulated pyrophosphate-energized sodium pump
MGLVVVGLGLGNIVVWFLLANWLVPAGDAGEGVRMVLITTTILTFGVGASIQAMFARVGTASSPRLPISV